MRTPPSPILPPPYLPFSLTSFLPSLPPSSVYHSSDPPIPLPASITTTVPSLSLSPIPSLPPLQFSPSYPSVLLYLSVNTPQSPPCPFSSPIFFPLCLLLFAANSSYASFYSSTRHFYLHLTLILPLPLLFLSSSHFTTASPPSPSISILFRLLQRNSDHKQQ